MALFIEMGVDDIGRDVPLLSQEPGGREEDDPQQGIFGGLHDPDRRLRKQESHADGVADGGRDEDQDDPGQGGHDVYQPVKKPSRILIPGLETAHFPRGFSPPGDLDITIVL